MAKGLLDNLMKVFKQNVTLAGTVAVSVELDFDIPRGYVIKIHDAFLQIVNITEDFEGITASKLAQVNVALVKDPDDTTTTTISSGRVDHDVLIDLITEVCITAAANVGVVDQFLNLKREQAFARDGLDVITARNMRLNADCYGTDAADFTEALAQAVVHYTLERITDSDILALLDIL